MRKAQHQYVPFLLLVAILFHCTTETTLADEPQIVAHYMPWYSANIENDTFGWHWTMNHFDPSKIDDEGKREIASHYQPVIGPYDSGDPHVLEYHALLMKFSGIDGVVFDWYGTRDFRDYAMINKNTRAMIPWLKRARLKFTFCYEDQTVKHMIADRKIGKSEDVAQTVFEFEQLVDEYFSDVSWIKVDNKPVLLVFGPQHFQPSSWNRVVKKLESPTLIFGLPHLTEKFGLDGAFAWPPVTGGVTLRATQWKKKLKGTYERHDNLIPVAFPAFHDIYSEAKLHDSYGFIDDRNGKTFAESLALAKSTDAKLIQIATWNDFGEGTIIEPTREFGYRYLEHLVEESDGSRVKKGDLRLPLELYKLRKANHQMADYVSKALFDGNIGEARKMLGIDQ